MFRIVMSSIMRRRRGLNSAIGGSCLRDGLQHPHPLSQEPLNKSPQSRRASGFVQSQESSLTSTTLADSFERSTEGSRAVRASIGRGGGEDCQHGAADRRQRRLRRSVADSFFPRSLRRGGGFADRRKRSSSSTHDDGGHARSDLRSGRGPVLP